MSSLISGCGRTGPDPTLGTRPDPAGRTEGTAIGDSERAPTTAEAPAPDAETEQPSASPKDAESDPTASAAGTDPLEASSEVDEPTRAHCSDAKRGSLIDGLNPAIEIDSISFYHDVTRHLCTRPTYSLAASNGSACASAADRASCVGEVKRLVAESADWGKYENFWQASWGLLVVTGSAQNIQRLGGPVQGLNLTSCGSWERGGERFGNGDPEAAAGSDSAGTRGSSAPEPSSGALSGNATTIADRKTLLALLGRIDTVNEATLVMWAHGFDIPCTVEKVAAEYRGKTRAMVSDCPITYQNYELRVSADGAVKALKLGAPETTGACVGRRPHGLTRPTEDTESDAFEATWLANVARLETAAVVAFAALSRELERLDAPGDLVERARVAALDEIRHARGVNALAVVRGGTTPPAVVELEANRSLLSLAVENAVEGCVRESWGALLAHYQAQAATDPTVRELWRAIAEEESAHAALSLDVARWLRTRLSPAEQEVVEGARLRAIAELSEELGHRGPGNATLGLPDRETRLALFDALMAS